jgi:hypothetical protein
MKKAYKITFLTVHGAKLEREVLAPSRLIALAIAKDARKKNPLILKTLSVLEI